MSTAISTDMRIDQPKQVFKVENDVQMDLYTLQNPIEPQTLVIYNKSSIYESNFNSNVPTRIFIHGFQSRGELKDTLTNGDYKNKDHHETINSDYFKCNGVRQCGCASTL